MKAGKVYLVGAGPGDPGLISQKGAECLAKAEVVVYDRLLDERLLNLAPPNAETIYVGKTAGKHSKKQSEINKLLIDRAKKGKRVIRLKGGDPFVLGRGGEEAEALKDKGIPFEIVPGVSSVVAVPAYAGIPLTHREMASSFAVITGHEADSKGVSSINWAKLATAVDTLVFLMGMKNLPEITAKLIENGRSPDTPVAVIQNGTSADQKTVVGNLENIAAKAEEADLSPPAVIIVGEVVKLGERLRWFDSLPLFGKRILVTRARRQARNLSRLLAQKGAQPVELPVIEIQDTSDTKELEKAIRNLSQYNYLVFTSINGVEAFSRQLYSAHMDSRALSGLKIGAIGPATAEALEEIGIIPDYIPEVYSSRGFVTGLKRKNISGKRFLLIRADIADEEMAQSINQLGGEVDEVIAYRTVLPAETSSQAREMVSSGQIDVATFTSSSTVTNFMTVFKNEKPSLEGVKIACIGPKTADTASRLGLKVDIVAQEHTIPGLVKALEEYFGKET
jgi:uroporphyrinogen III methyltransferase/synthase